VGNQFLPGLGGGYANLGYVPIDLNSVPIQQFATLSLVQLPGDWDGDGDVDLSDYEQLLTCMTGPGGTALGPGCSVFDFEPDQDVDLYDAAAFMRSFNP
jgi:hypothetical protein